MDKKKVEKIAALLVAILVCVLALQDIQDWTEVGIYSGCGLTSRLLYPFHHANILHALLNAWCLLSVVFIYETSLWRLALAYIIAISYPVDALAGLGIEALTPTVGLSGAVFALFGSISFEVERKTYYQLWMLAYLVVGFLFPYTNAWIHLYCYAAGILFAILNAPIRPLYLNPKDLNRKGVIALSALLALLGLIVLFALSALLGLLSHSPHNPQLIP